MLAWVVWGCEKGFAWVAGLFINIARIGVKVRVGLEKIFYENVNALLYFIFQLDNSDKLPTGSPLKLRQA